MDVTSGQIKQILQLIDDRGTSFNQIQKLLGGHLSDLLHKEAKPTAIHREMWKGLLGMEFIVGDHNTISIKKTETAFEASFHKCTKSGSTPDEAIGHLIREICHRFGLGVRWGDDPLTSDYRRHNPDQFPRYWKIFIISDYSKWAGMFYGPFKTAEDALACLREKKWRLNVNETVEQADLWFGWPCPFTLINAIVRPVYFRDQTYLNNPGALPPGQRE